MTLFDVNESASATKQMRDHQELFIEQVRAAAKAGHKRIIGCASVGWGKCHGAGTKVIMWDGQLRSVEHVMTGDRLMGPDSKPRTVLNTVKGYGPLYLVEPVKGEPFVCNDVHVLSLKTTPTSNVSSGPAGRKIYKPSCIVNIPLDEYLSLPKSRQQDLKLWRTAIEFSNDLALPLDPYMMGVFLGDGSMSRSPGVTTADSEIVDAVSDLARAMGMRVRRAPQEGNLSSTYFITSGKGQKNRLTDIFRSLGATKNCGDKRIPFPYRVASREQRLQLLAGLIDTDGYVYPNHLSMEFCTKSQALMEDFAFLCRSLGFAVNPAPKVINGVTYYRTKISGDYSLIPTRIARKQVTKRRIQKKDVLVSGFDVSFIGNGDYFGFALDGDHLYLLRDFTVTHNTLVSANLFKSGYSKGKVSMFTVPRNALIEPSVEEFEGEGLSDIGIIQQDHPRTNPWAKLQIASIHTAINRELPKLDFVIVDEVHLSTELFLGLLDSEEWKNKIVIGLSATPWKKGMGLRWTSLIQTKKTAQLIEEGYLVKPRYLVGSEEPKTDGIKTHLDEDGNRVMTDKAEAEVMGEQRIIGDIVKTYLKYGEDRPGFYYAVNLAHARQLRDEFEAKGITCGYIDGSMTREQRNMVLRAYREARYRLVVNYGVLTTGIDCDVRIIGICRIIKSETDWVQIIGRGLRTDNPHKRIAGLPPKIDCMVIDHGGNLTRDDGTALAPAEDIYHDYLDTNDPKDKKTKAYEKDEKPATHRKCKRCGGLIPPKTKRCPACGDEGLPTYMGGKAIEAEFSEFNGQKTKKPKKEEITPAQKEDFYSQLIWIADEKGRKRGWADWTFKEKFGHFPTRKHGIEPKPSTQMVDSYVRSRMIAKAKSNSKMGGSGASTPDESHTLQGGSLHDPATVSILS